MMTRGGNNGKSNVISWVICDYNCNNNNFNENDLQFVR